MTSAPFEETRREQSIEDVLQFFFYFRVTVISNQWMVDNGAVRVNRCLRTQRKVDAICLLKTNRNARCLQRYTGAHISDGFEEQVRDSDKFMET